VGPAHDLLLKVTAPRVPKQQLARQRLQVHEEPLRQIPVILVQAPAGYGKTSLLAQWRREHLARGAVVAWLSAQAEDDPQRLVQGLVLAVRTGAGRPGFGHALFQTAASADGLEGVTMWLAEVAQLAMDVVLIVDEADRLPAPAREALAYVLRNAPPNLSTLVGARADCQLGIDDLIAYGQCAVVGPTQLRFGLDETLELVHQRFGARVDRDAAARLHELTEGWPLGLQLALSVMGASAEPQAQVAAMASRGGGALRDQLVSLLLANLDPRDASLLTKIAFLDDLHPDLCQAVASTQGTTERLVRLARDTPIFVAGEASEWLRMHALARDELRRRFAALKPDQRTTLHARAADWLAAHGLTEAAAANALASGQHEKAYELAERSLYEAFVTRGRQGAVLDWVARLPAAEIDRRPRLLLAEAWVLALSERHQEASRLVERILAQPEVDDARRCECALILSGAAVFADDPDRFAELHDPWAENPPLTDPQLLRIHANRTTFRKLVEGEPALARLRRQQLAQADPYAEPGYVDRWGELLVGLTYLWEGQALLAEQQLRPALIRAEAGLGRRNGFTCMLATVLAAALWDRNQTAEAGAVLANRLDVLERGALPVTVLLGFDTLARVADLEGAEHRALELLGALDAVGTARRLPRLRVASLVGQLRLHARRFRAETCRALCAQLDTLLADPGLPQGRLWRRSVTLLHAVALGHAAFAAREWRRAAEALAQAAAMAQAIKLGRLHLELLALRAFAADRCGEKTAGSLREVADLARTYGMQRVFADAHPAVDDWSRQVLSADAGSLAGPGPLAAPMRAPPPATRDAAQARSTPSMALTPKEREVLELLSRSLSNKEIGRAMQVGEETIKWHVKNLFAKLDAGTRKQVVSRARILGLLEAAA
jgi:LuxR family maltose regulon positive regulatory protein